jgi:membrane protein required for colicin V production
MSFTYLDVGLLIIMLLSGLFAMARGFVREVLSIGSWLLAAFTAVWLHPRFMSLATEKIPNEMIAKGVVIGIIFIIVLMLVSFITGRISDMILNSAVGFIDRALGFVFGMARGFLIVTIAFMFFTWLVPTDKDGKGGSFDFVKNAKSLSALQQTADKIWSFIPDNASELMKKQIDKAIPPKQ